MIFEEIAKLICGSDSDVGKLRQGLFGIRSEVYSIGDVCELSGKFVSFGTQEAAFGQQADEEAEFGIPDDNGFPFWDLEYGGNDLDEPASGHHILHLLEDGKLRTKRTYAAGDGCVCAIA